MPFFLHLTERVVRNGDKCRVFASRLDGRRFAFTLTLPFMKDIATDTVEVRNAIGKTGDGKLGALASHSHHGFRGKVFGVPTAATSEEVSELSADLLEPALCFDVPLESTLSRTCRIEEVEERVPGFRGERPAMKQRRNRLLPLALQDERGPEEG